MRVFCWNRIAVSVEVAVAVAVAEAGDTVEGFGAREVFDFCSH